ncbi:MAG: WD40 repeat domain-containing protein [Gemmataceae bacterium]
MAPATVELPVQIIEAVESPQLVATLKVQGQAVRPVAWSPDGKTLAGVVFGEKSVIKLWDAAARKERATLPCDLGPSFGLAFTPDNKTLLVSHHQNDPRAGPTGGISLWDVATGKRTSLMQETPSRGVARIALSPDGKVLAAIERYQVIDKQVSELTFRDFATGKIEGSIEESIGSGLTFSPDGKTIVASTILYEGNKWLGSKVRRWETASGEEISSLPNPASKAPCNSLAFSPDGSILAGADFEGNIILWESSTGKVRTSIKQEDQRRITSLAFSPDGKTLAAGMAERPGRDHDPGLIVLWDPVTGKERLTLTGHTNGVASIAFSPDGKLLASGGADRTVRLWDMTTEATKAR